jgi:hypothetical protein
MLFVCSFLAAALMAGPALAAPSTDGDKCVKDKSGILHCSFGGSEIPGIIPRPEEVIRGDRPQPPGGSLIDYREDFVDELLKTAEEL